MREALALLPILKEEGIEHRQDKPNNVEDTLLLVLGWLVF